MNQIQNASAGKFNELPADYLDNMKRILGDGEVYQRFLASYDDPPARGIYFNLRKVRPETIRMLQDRWQLEPVPWCPQGYYYDPEIVRPGKSPYHDAGVFYMQEPSAMIAGVLADVQEGDLVLDLCAAPGGKTAALAQKAGLLVANEIMPDRAKILSSNVERLGFDNCIVTQASPDELAEALPVCFDRIVVDAPCSGEGMMRKDPVAAEEWSADNVSMCAGRQAMILEEAWKMLKPGGFMVYSTCTFETEEDEGQTADFLEKHSDALLLKECRLWPHEVRGEGHYAALLQKREKAGEPGKQGDIRAENRTAYEADERRDERREEPGNVCSAKKTEKTEKKRKKNGFERKGIQDSVADLLTKGGIHILRKGVEPGVSITGRFKGETRYEPSHAQCMAGCLQPGFELKDEDSALKYLKGEVLSPDADLKQTDGTAQKGYAAVLFDGYPLGIVKNAGNILKNHYPKGLRRMNG